MLLGGCTVLWLQGAVPKAIISCRPVSGCLECCFTARLEGTFSTLEKVLFKEWLLLLVPLSIARVGKQG